MATVWKIEAAWDIYNNCPGQTLYFRKKENALKCLRKWLIAETKKWQEEGQDPTWTAGCKTWDDVVNYLMFYGGDPDVAWLDTVKFEDEGEDENED